MCETARIGGQLPSNKDMLIRRVTREDITYKSFSIDGFYQILLRRHIQISSSDAAQLSRDNSTARLWFRGLLANQSRTSLSSHTGEFGVM